MLWTERLLRWFSRPIRLWRLSGSGVLSMPSGFRSVLRVVGSLSLAAVLLVLLLVAMACATVYEATHGTAQAQLVFYKARWFEGLLILLALNVLASVLVRYPFGRRQIGFVVTHISVLAILVGAWVTKMWGIDGQIAVREGQTIRQFSIQQDVLTLQDHGHSQAATVDLDQAVFGGLQAVDRLSAERLVLGDVSVSVDRYLPDSRLVEQVRDDNPKERAAIEVSLSGAGESVSTWAFANASAEDAQVPVAFRVVSEDAEWKLLMRIEPTTKPSAAGTVRVEVKDAKFEWPLEQCLNETIPVGQTGYTLRVLRYMPHATVGADRKVVNASDQPVNPAIEAELTGAEGTLRRWAFARFPDFGSMHGMKDLQDLRLTFVAAPSTMPAVPIEVVGGPGGEIGVRFVEKDGRVTSRKLRLGETVDTPWSSMRFSVRRWLSHARMERVVEPVEPARSERVPALQLTVAKGPERRTVWVRKGEPETIPFAQSPYMLSYGAKSLPLGFDLKLNQFRIGYYPGTMRPRSFESDITMTDPADGRSRSQVISMNNPARHRGYRLFQSSYQLDQQDGPATSVLSVSWDPGQPLVFVGYAVLIVGLLWVLAGRAWGKQRGPEPPGLDGA